MQKMTRETLKILATVNGLRVSDERLDLLLREYESLMRSLAELNALPLAREAEPANVFSLAVPSASDGGR
jgi:Asp-tRNA(Asn)/Glu-tRNA(Gln) amidotransferase C subunit